MEKGIYINEKNEVVFFGHRKGKDPDGMEFHICEENEIPLQLKRGGKFTKKFIDGVIIDNENFILSETKEKKRIKDIADIRKASGLEGSTIAQAEKKIDDIFKDAKTIDEVKESTIEALKILLVQVIK